MSPEAAFSPLSFPSLPGVGGDERATIRGHAAGYAAGRRQAELEAEALRQEIADDAARRLDDQGRNVSLALEALGRSAQELQSRELPVLQSLDAAILAAAVELAEAIIGRELAAVRDAAQSAIDRALTPAGSVAASVRLHPADLAVIERETAGHPALELVADPTLARGDAIAFTADGSVDARISSALARAKAALLGGVA